VFAADGICRRDGDCGLAQASVVRWSGNAGDPVTAGALSRKTVHQNLTYQGPLYGRRPERHRGRVIYFNKKVFRPGWPAGATGSQSWDLTSSPPVKLKTCPWSTHPDHAGIADGGSRPTAQGFFPLLAGTGQPAFATHDLEEWQGATPQVHRLSSTSTADHHVGPATRSCSQASPAGISPCRLLQGQDRHARRGDYFCVRSSAHDKSTPRATLRRCPTATRRSVTRSSRPRSRLGVNA